MDPYLFVSVFHVVLLFGFIAYKAGPKVKVSVRDRSKTIEEKLTEAKRAAEEMRRRQQEIESRANNLPQLKEKVFSEWQEREREQLERIRIGSEKVREQLRQDAARNMAALQGGLVRDVKSAIARKLVLVAEQKVVAGLNAGAKTNLQNAFLGQIERSS